MPWQGTRRLVLACVVVLQAGCSAADVHPANGGSDRVGVLIDGNPLCPDCEIAFRVIATLGGDDDPGSVWDRAAGRGCMVSRLSSGEFLLSGVVGGGQVFLYDSDGGFSGTVGRRGQGPGEIRGMARLWVGPGDTLFVADDGNGRLQVLTSSGDFVRSFSVPAPYRRFARLNDGTFVFHGPMLNPNDPVFHLVDAHGVEMRRFRPSRVAAPDTELGIVTPRAGSGGAFWTASGWRYAIEEWSDSETLERTLVRDVPWFPPDPVVSEAVFSGSAPPPPTLFHMGEDDARRLWVYVFLPDPNWRPGIPLDPRPEWQRATFDHRIEVIDITETRVVVADEHEDRLAPVCNSNLMYTVVETPRGDLRVRVVEPTVVDSDGREWIGGR